MPRIILKSNYLKASRRNVTGFLKYIATRAGVVKYTSDSGLLSATKKQTDFIAECLSLYPDSGTLFEYEDYQKNPTRENASAFISSATEYYLLGEKQSQPELYAKYVATRPNSRKLNTHGLFGMTENISLAKSMEELTNHKGNVWTHIVSIRREDAQRLGYDNVEPWVNLVRSQTAQLAKQMKIKPHNLVWYGAFHDESHHPHIHLMVYSKDESEGYLTKQGINKLRGSFAKNIFKQDLISIYDRQTTARDDLKQELVVALLGLEEAIATGDFNREPLRSRFIKLAEDLSQRKKGKNTYGYLPKVLKKQVDSVLDLFAEDETIGNCYREWNTLRQEVLSTYQDKEAEILPLSGQKEFQHLKNIIIKNAVEYTHPVPPSIVAEPIDTSPIVLDEKRTLSPSEEETAWTHQKVEDSSKPRYPNSLWSKEYKQCRHALFNEKDFEKAHQLLVLECEKENPLAYSDLARLYADGLGVEINPQKADALYKKSLELFLVSVEEQPSDYLAYRIGKMYLYGLGAEMDTKKAVGWLTVSAEKDNKYAQYTLGMLYLKGNGVEQNTEKAVELLKRSADQKNPYAEYQYGQYLQETLSAPDFNKNGYHYLSSAFSHFVSMEVESEDDSLSYRIGKMLEDGIGVKADSNKAMTYFEKSAQLKNPHALIAVIKGKMENDTPITELRPYLSSLQELADNQNSSASYFLGKLLEDGSVVQKDDSKAIHYYLQVADQNSYASYRLGKLLLESEQMEPNLQAGISWLVKSAEDHNPYAQYKLGKLLLLGEVVEQDIPQAVSYLQTASLQNNEPACYLLGKLYEQGEFVEKDESKAFQLYSRIAEKNSYASYRLGNLILHSSELDIDRSIGIYWLEKSAEMENPLAWFKLGKQYISGELIGQNIPRALFYLEKSAEENNSFAYYELAKLYLYGVGVDKDESLGMQYLLHSIRLGNEYAQQLLERYKTPKSQFAFKNMLRSFHSLFSSPPAGTAGESKQPVIDKKQRSKLKRKKIALGHARDDREMDMIK